MTSLHSPANQESPKQSVPAYHEGAALSHVCVYPAVFTDTRPASSASPESSCPLVHYFSQQHTHKRCFTLTPHIMAGPPPSKTRRPNFSQLELTTLMDEVRKRESIILVKHDSKVTQEKKTVAWNQITDAVNSVGRVPRTAEELRKKFKDLRAQTKSKAARHAQHMEGTGK